MQQLQHLILFSLITFCWCKSVDVGITSVSIHIYNHDIMELMEVFVVPHNGRNTLNGSLIYRVPLQDFQAKFTLDIVKADNTPVRLVNVDVDACKFLEQAYGQNIVAKIIMQGLQNSKSFPRKCPLEAHKLYTLEYFDLHVENVPAYMSDIRFNATATIVQHRKKIYDVLLSGYVKLLRNKSKKEA